MDLGLADKTVWVAAASTGIGFACARTFAEEGARVALCARREAPLRAAVEALGGGDRVAGIVADLATAEGVAHFAAEAERRVGAPHALVVNAGGPPSGAFTDLDDAAWAQAVDLTLLSAVRLSRAAIARMPAAGGRVVYITSLYVKQPPARMVLSNTLRAGVTALAKTLVAETAGRGITFNCVAPGYTATERLGSLADALAKARGTDRDAVYRGWEQAIPAGRLGKPEEVAAAVAFLASAPAAYINGVTLTVDGGWTTSLI